MGRQVGEWLEIQFQTPDQPAGVDRLPQWSLPDWLGDALVWAMILGGLTWVGWRSFPPLGRWLRAHWQQRQQNSRVLDQSGERLDRFSATQWRSQAEQWAHQGNYPQACLALYRALLAQLATHQGFTLGASDTDQDCKIALRSLGQLAWSDRQWQASDVLLELHERFCFSDRPLTQVDFQQGCGAYGELWGKPKPVRGQDAKN